GIRAFHVTGVQTCALPISDTSRPDRTTPLSRRSIVHGRLSAFRGRGRPETVAPPRLPARPPRGDRRSFPPGGEDAVRATTRRARHRASTRPYTARAAHPSVSPAPHRRASFAEGRSAPAIRRLQVDPASSTRRNPAGPPTIVR